MRTASGQGMAGMPGQVKCARDKLQRSAKPVSRKRAQRSQYFHFARRSTAQVPTREPWPLLSTAPARLTTGFRP